MTERPRLKDGKAEMLITFIYYKDMQKGADFYGKVLGFPLAIDQGKVSKIFRISEGGYLGIVDEAEGMQNWHEDKTVQICLRVPDADAWYEYCKDAGVNNLSRMFNSERLKIKAFVFDDPEGYQVEIQESTE
ncbi:MAG: VOC family protein [Spirochaetales bacterium]|nr:VOC family protein [Spirochaetales bacterium]